MDENLISISARQSTGGLGEWEGRETYLSWSLVFSCTEGHRCSQQEDHWELAETSQDYTLDEQLG